MRSQGLLSPRTLPLTEERPSGLKGLGCVGVGRWCHSLSHTLCLQAPITTSMQGPSWLGPLLALCLFFFCTLTLSSVTDFFFF